MWRWFVLSLFLFLVVVTVMLYRRLPEEGRNGVWFFALASLGLWLLNVGGDYVIYGRVEPFTWFAEMCFALVVWAVWTAFFLYQARRYFTKPEEEKPNGNGDNVTNSTRR
jgi:membrane protein implicated in regulation of membrane protease activity